MCINKKNKTFFSPHSSLCLFRSNSASMLLLVGLLVLLANAYPGMLNNEPVPHYSLMCPDETVAVDKGLHACCEKEPFIYCVLCARFAKGHYTSCTEKCNGTVIKEEPYCTDCLCKPVDPPPPKASNDKEEASGHHKCPFRRGKKEV